MIVNLTIQEALKALKSRSFSARELTETYIKNIEIDKTNSFITTTFDLALKQAEKADENFKNGTAKKLEGIPLGIKDLFCTKNILTTAGSKILSNFIPTYESTVTQKLWDAGAIMLGKLNMDEFAMGSANSFSYYGQVINPWRASQNPVDLVPGGSSGGSAAAVAANLVMGSLGSDTGGSVRQPAGFCGIVGIKPTYGRCSRYGMVAFASSLDQAGVFAKTVEEASLLLETIAGFDSKDSTSADLPVEDLSKNILQQKRSLRIGIPREYDKKGMPEAIKKLWHQAANWLKEEGHEVIDISLPHTDYALPVYYIIAPAEASSNLARYDGVRYGLRAAGEHTSLDELYELTRSEGFGSEVKRRLMIGSWVLSASAYDTYYRRAQAVRELIIQDFELSFEKVDVILTPTTPTEAFPVGYKEADPTIAYLNDIFTCPANLAGLPCMSIPIGLSENGLPLGIQLIAKRFDEITMLYAGYQVENHANFNHRPNEASK